MAETDNKAPGGVNDPVTMRNTETAALKRVPVSPNAASASSAARKTIKLKPLAPSGIGASAAAPASATRSVPPPSILMNHKPAAPISEEPPKFMSTNTAPINKIAKPQQEKPIPAANLNDAPTKTVSIPRLQAKMNARPPAPAAAPAPDPAPATATVSVPKATPAPKPAPPVGPPSTATVSVPKITPATVSVPKITPAPKPTPPAGPPSTATVSVPKITPATVSVPKITPATKPAPGAPAVSTATVGVSRIKPAAAGTAPVDPKSATVVLPGGESATTTQGIQRQAIDQAKMQSGLQGAKPAIKLRPSNAPAQSPETLSPVSPTIKLTPKADSTVSPMPPPAEPEQTDASQVTVTTKIPRKTLQLKPKMPAAATEARLKEQGDIANQNIKSGVEAGEQSIKQENEPPVEKAVAKSKKDSSNAEPNIIFSISAIIAFIIIGYTVFALTAQFLNMWEGQKLPVAGFQQIFDSSKK